MRGLRQRGVKTKAFTVYGSGVNGDYIAASVLCSPNYFLLMFNRATNLFDIKLFPGLLFGIGLDTTGR